VRFEAGAPDGLTRVVGDLGVAVEHLSHVAIRLFDAELHARAGVARHRLVGQLLDERLFLLQPAVTKSRTSSLTEVRSTLAWMT
jgi:hypothetical protein